jgi:hypothetical protein
MEYARQRYICRAFYFTGHMCVVKFMTGFRIDGRNLFAYRSSNAT